MTNTTVRDPLDTPGITTQEVPDMKWYWLNTCPEYCVSCVNLLIVDFKNITKEELESLTNKTIKEISVYIIPTKNITNDRHVLLCDKVLTNGRNVESFNANGLITEASLSLCKLKNFRNLTYHMI